MCSSPRVFHLWTWQFDSSSYLVQRPRSHHWLFLIPHLQLSAILLSLSEQWIQNLPFLTSSLLPLYLSKDSFLAWTIAIAALPAHSYHFSDSGSHGYQRKFLACQVTSCHSFVQSPPMAPFSLRVKPKVHFHLLRGPHIFFGLTSCQSPNPLCLAALVFWLFHKHSNMFLPCGLKPCSSCWETLSQWYSHI